MQDFCHVPFSMSHRMLAEETSSLVNSGDVKRKKIKKVQQAAFQRLRTRYEGYDFRVLPKLYLLLFGIELKKSLSKVSFFTRLKLRARLFLASLVAADSRNADYYRAVENCKRIVTQDELSEAFAALSPNKKAALISFFDVNPMSHQKIRLDFSGLSSHPKRLSGAFNALAKGLERRGLKEAFSWIVRIENAEKDGQLPEEFFRWLQSSKSNPAALQKAEEIWVLFSGSLSELDTSFPTS